MIYPEGKTFGKIRVLTDVPGEHINVEVLTQPESWNESVANIASDISSEISKKEVAKYSPNLQKHFEKGISTNGRFVTSSIIIEDGAMFKVDCNYNGEMYVIWSDGSFFRIRQDQWTSMTYPEGKSFANIRVVTDTGNEVQIYVFVQPKEWKEGVSLLAKEAASEDSKKIKDLYSVNPAIQTESGEASSTAYPQYNTTSINIPDKAYYRIVTNATNPEIYVIWSDGSNQYISQNQWRQMIYPEGKTFGKIRVLTDVPGEHINVEVLTKTEIWQNMVSPGDVKIRALILGDSYSANGGRWAEPMLAMLPVGSSYISLAVSSATIKDRYADRAAYPYTSRPVSTDNAGNHNTLACQIEKLKRLMQGTDLDDGETAIYQSAEEYPNVIIIEGGMNDGTDANTDNYYDQLEKVVDGVWKKRYASDDPEQGKVTIKTPIEEVDRTCFAGAYRYLADELLQLFPNAQIFITTCSSISYRNGNPISQKRTIMAEQQRLCSDIFAFNLIDWHRDGQINSIANYPMGSGTESDPYIWGELE